MRESAIAYPAIEHFIGGAWLAGSGSDMLPVVDPATEEELGRLPVATAGDLDRALAAVEQGFLVWRDMTAHDRFKIMRRAADLMRERAKAIGRILTLEQGKPLAESVREVALSGDIIEFLAEEGKRAYGRIVPARTNGILSQNVMKVPIGPVAAFTPWNFPANLPSRKIGGALAAGCSMILKPAEQTPGTAVEIVRCFEEAGLPKGVLNLVFGIPDQVSRHLVASPVIRKVTFTGSIAVGKILGKLAAEGVKRFTPELGGHAPVIVVKDADIDKVVKASVIGKYRNAGQVCASPTRFIVERQAAARFTEGFVEAARRLRVGSGLEEGVEMGPLTHARRLDHMAAHVGDARATGGRVLLGGERLGNKGYFFAPTVIADAPAHARVMTDEPFGPIAAITSFDRLEEAIALANALPYGLAAYAFTNDLERADYLGRRIEAGMVGINHFGISQPETPFGGVKESGYGSESGQEGLEGYTDTKLVSFGRL